MKHLMIASLALLMTSFAFPQQQDGPPKPPPPEKRWEKDSEKIKKAVTLTTDELTKMKDAFMTFYKEMDALHEKNKGQRPAKEDVEKIRNKRNDGIKKFLAKDKYDKFMKLEKELGPPKPKDRRE
jgi:predicted  nucleic acid-binding Zn-ribbon protein